MPRLPPVTRATRPTSIEYRFPPRCPREELALPLSQCEVRGVQQLSRSRKFKLTTPRHDHTVPPGMRRRTFLAAAPCAPERAWPETWRRDTLVHQDRGDMRVAIAELKQETNTFVPRPTTLADFAAWHLWRGADLVSGLRDTNTEIAGFLDVLESAGIEPIPI